MEKQLIQIISQLNTYKENLYKEAEVNCSQLSEQNADLARSFSMQLNEFRKTSAEELSRISTKGHDEKDNETFNSSLLSELTKFSSDPVCTIVVFGRTGVGKSALINQLVGKNVVKEGHTIFSETFKCISKTFELNGLPITIVDTPGFGDNRSNVRPRDLIKEIVAFLASIKNLSVCLFCLPGTNARVDAHDQKEIRLVSTLMGKAMINHFVVAITRINTLSSEQKKIAHQIYGEELEKSKILPQTPQSILFCDFDHIETFKSEIYNVIQRLGTSPFEVSLDPSNEKDLQKAIMSTEMREFVEQFERNVELDYQDAQELKEDLEGDSNRNPHQEEVYQELKRETELLKNQLTELRLLKAEQQQQSKSESEELFSKNGKGTLLAESIPIADKVAGIIHFLSGNIPEAKRAFSKNP